MRADRAALGLPAALALTFLGTAGAHARESRPDARSRAQASPVAGIRLVESTPAGEGDPQATGRARLAIGDLPGALAAFRAALLVAPASVDALNGIGVAYDRLGRSDLARSFYDSALAIDPAAAAVLVNLGLSLTLQGDDRGAIPFLQQAGATDRDPAAAATARRLLALIAQRLRDTAIAEARAEVATELAGPAPAPAPAPTPGRAPAPVTVIAPPSMRIEVTSAGEQRLVLDGPAPDPALTASLGDAASEVLVARAWHHGDDRRLAATAAAVAAAAAAAAAAAPTTANAAPSTTPPGAATDPFARLAGALAAFAGPRSEAPATPGQSRPAPVPVPVPASPRALAITATATTTAVSAVPRAGGHPTPLVVALRPTDLAAGPGRRADTPATDGALPALARKRPLITLRLAAMPTLPAPIVTAAEAIRRLERLIARVRAA